MVERLIGGDRGGVGVVGSRGARDLARGAKPIIAELGIVSPELANDLAGIEIMDRVTGGSDRVAPEWCRIKPLGCRPKLR